MNDIAWLMNVLTDLRKYARQNKLVELDLKLSEVAEIALLEIGSGQGSHGSVQELLDYIKSAKNKVDPVTGSPQKKHQFPAK